MTHNTKPTDMIWLAFHLMAKDASGCCTALVGSWAAAAPVW
jgi:hypothetical protein